jgi:2,3,4,5-tetrahydropyridine-2-carboxylate N-succinyltransferase
MTDTIFEQMGQFWDLSADDILKVAHYGPAKELLGQFLSAMEQGTLRTASRQADGTWVVEPRVKKAILMGFRLGKLTQMGDTPLSFVDKDTFPIRHFSTEDKVRLVPGGSSVRRGAYMAPTVTMMPPAYVNVGAYVDEGTMVDSHALVGSCAQIGKRVHLSAAAQVGGVLEPIGAMPVIIEDDAFIGGNTGIYEGTLIRERAVIAAGVVLTGSSRVYDVVNETIISALPGQPLEIPAGAVVVPGSRPARGDFAKENGLMVSAAVIIKYRDDKTDSKAALEDDLRA